MASRGVDGSAMRADAGDVAHLGQGVEVEDADVAGGAGAGDVEVAAVGVGGDVVESAVATDELDLEDLVGTGVLGERGTGAGQDHGEDRDG